MSRNILFSAFFLSGMSALIYEVVWSRTLTLIFGASVYGQSIVLALFMGGLSLGAKWAGRYCSISSLSPQRVYALLEGLVCLLGAASAVLPALCFPIATQSSSLDFILRLLVCTLVILPATMAMGGTFPVLYKALSSGGSSSTLTQVSTLYVVNTLGACVGIALSAYWMIFSLGIRNTLFAAAAVNLLLFLFFVKRGPSPETPGSSFSRDEPQTPSPLRSSTLGSLFFCGMATMVYEVSWSRALCFSFGSSTYTFALILFAFLAGLTFGAFWIKKKPMNRRQMQQTLCDLQTRIAIGAVFFTFLALRLPMVTKKLFDLSGGLYWKVHLLEVSILFLMMAPVAIFIGASFPILCALLTDSGKPNEAQIGAGYGMNTLGAIVGAMLTGFVLVPQIGPFNTLWIALVLQILVMLLSAPEPAWKSLLGNAAMMGSVGLFAWVQFQSASPLDLLSGYYSQLYNISSDAVPRYLAENPAFSTSQAKRNSEKNTENRLMSFRHGVISSVAVVKNKHNTRLVIDGKTDASVGAYYESDMPTQSFLALLPLLYSPRQERALVVGLGSGVTTGILSRHARQVDCLEIERRVLEALPYFQEYNFDVRNRKNVRFIVDDARKVIRNSEKTYDLISAEPSNVWVSGVAQLFTREYFEDCRRILEKDGVMVQWVHFYKLSCDDLKIAVRTFASVFPRMDIWGSFNFGDLFLVGWKDETPSGLTQERFEACLKKDSLESDMQSMGAGTLEKLLRFRLYSGIWRGSMDNLHTDDRPILEYSAGKNMFTLEAGKIFEWIGQGLPDS